MPPPPFWNHGLGLPAGLAVWNPQIPVWNTHVPPAPQSAVAKHTFPGVGPPEHSPPPLYSHTGLALIPAGLLKTERSANQPPSLFSKLHGTLSPAPGPVADARIPRS